MRKLVFDNIEKTIQYGVDIGMAYQATDEVAFDGKICYINDKKHTAFSLCDYLGLSTDDRIKEEAIKATEKYGVFTSISRTYMRLGLYDTVEALLDEIFEKPTILISRTSLAHIATIPVITDTNDAIILDHQVHTSVRNAVDIVKGYGNYVETLRHNRIDRLEERIIELSKTHDKVWYCADGVYSMHGDFAPFKELKRLLDTYEQFHLYIDDAHGMSWNGKNGQGVVLKEMGFHDKMIMATSLAKGFGTGGAVIICPNDKIRRSILYCGAPLIFSGPVAPPTMGAIKASAEIHLSPEINDMQERLGQLIYIFRQTCKSLNIPLIADVQSPIFYAAGGQPDTVIEMGKEMMDYGYLGTSGVYPAVPLNKSGLRLMVSLNHTGEEIISFLHTLKIIYDKKLEEKNTSVKQILKFYR